jgi:transposase
MILTYQYRIKDATTGKHLAELARYVNTAWNRLVHEQKQIQRHYAPGGPNLPWKSRFDCNRHFTGRSGDCGLHSDTLSEIARVFVTSRNTHTKCPKWRGRKSLGWIPFIKRAIRIDGDTVRYLGQTYRLWLSRPIGGTVKAGSFSQDARGRWYVNLQCEVASIRDCGEGEIGLDLGCLDLATGSDGRKIENPRWFARHENALAVAQRAHNKKRVRAIHAKIGNSRKHRLHTESIRLVREFGRIVVGDVNARALARTGMAKSVLDASWSAFRGMLRYKAIRHGATYEEADERGSTQTCSACGARSGPKGIAGLRIRRWVCSECGVTHDRDVCAALNILAGAERRPLAEEIPVL